MDPVKEIHCCLTAIDRETALIEKSLIQMLQASKTEWSTIEFWTREELGASGIYRSLYHINAGRTADTILCYFDPKNGRLYFRPRSGGAGMPWKLVPGAGLLLRDINFLQYIFLAAGQ